MVAMTISGASRQRLLDACEARVATAMGLVNVATAELVGAIAEVLTRDAWQVAGIVSAEHWVTWRCGVSPTRARHLVATARKLNDLPASTERFESGALTEDQMRVITTHADSAHDGQVADLAPACTVTQLRRVLPTIGAPMLPVLEADEPGPGDTPGKRVVSFGTRDDGSWTLRAILPSDEGAVVERALQAARGELFDDADTAQRDGGEIGWSDALLRVGEVALDHLDPAAAAGRPAGERYQILLHVDADRPEDTRLHLGPALPASMRRFLSCDASVRAVVERAGIAVAATALQRTVPARVRALVEHRDQSCRVPGCGRRKRLHIHHLIHWEDGGLTILENLAALCPMHHRLHHQGRLQIYGDPNGELSFKNEYGTAIRGPSPRPPGDPPADLLPTPLWTNPTGERLDASAFVWN
jgi:hypothetical protein